MKEVTAVSPFAASLTLLQLNRLVTVGRSPGYRKDKLFFPATPIKAQIQNGLTSCCLESWPPSKTLIVEFPWADTSKWAKFIRLCPEMPISHLHDCLRGVLGTVAVLVCSDLLLMWTSVSAPNRHPKDLSSLSFQMTIPFGDRSVIFKNPAIRQLICFVVWTSFPFKLLTYPPRVQNSSK